MRQKEEQSEPCKKNGGGDCKKKQIGYYRTGRERPNGHSPVYPKADQRIL